MTEYDSTKNVFYYFLVKIIKLYFIHFSTPDLSPAYNGLSGSGDTPILSHNLENDENDEVDATLMEKIKGDAIGDTLYSQRFILTTLMKLPNLDKLISDDKDYEQDLCTVWDQTVEKDVVKFLLEYKVLEIFAACVNEEDGRLTEILVGIIANMCALSETRQQLEASPEITITIISLISSDDPLVLIQLMRFFHAVLVFENSGDELIWFQYFAAVENFVPKFSFVLASSTSSTLLRHTLEALHAICAKFAVIEIRPEGGQSSFVDMFVTPFLIAGLIEAFDQVVGGKGSNGEVNESMSSALTEKIIKFMSLFLDINVILTQYDQVSKNAYSEKLPEFLNSLGRVLEPLCQAEYLFPLCTTTQGIIENLSDILQALDYPFDEKCWQHLITICTIIIQKRQNCEKQSDWDDDNSRDKELDSQDLCHTLLEIVCKSVSNAGKLENAVTNVEEKSIKDLLNLIVEDDFSDEREMLKNVLDMIKKK